MTHSDTKRMMPSVLKSIPIDRGLKSYYWSKYEFLRSHNGPQYAAEVFKLLRESIMTLIEGGPENILDAKANLDYFSSVPIRKNGWLKMLLDYAATDPISVMQFLKLYTTEPEPLVTTEEAAEKQAEELQKATPAEANIYITAWVELIQIPFGAYQKEHDLISRGFFTGNSQHVVYYKGKRYTFPGRDATVRKDQIKYKMLTRSIYPCFNSNDGVKVLREYLGKWTRLLSKPRIPEKAMQKQMWLATPSESSYCSSEYGKIRVKNGLGDFERDLNAFVSAMQYGDFDPYLEALDQKLREDLSEWWAFETLPQTYKEQLVEQGLPLWTTAAPVGCVHHIPKKGTVKRRSIAAPNRFLQACFKPCQMQLRAITGRLPRNAQFLQDRFDQEIQRNLNEGFAGCWDLHSATDWLPVNWFTDIAQELGWFPQGSLENWSYQLFLSASKGFWENGDGYGQSEFVQWQRGQPLGTWPSFEVLTITHHLVLESLSLFLGHTDSPYAVLGDDNVIFDYRVWMMYGRVMSRAGCPISTHKSYAGRLVEFAGKLFVKNQQYAYAPNQTPIYLTNLFDYQRSSGKAIRWADLPKSVRGRFAQLCSEHSGQVDPRSIYIAIQACIGLRVPKISKEIGSLIENFVKNGNLYLSPEEKKELKELKLAEARQRAACNTQEWVRFNGLLLTFGNPRIHRRETEEWFRRKFRPLPTLKAVELCTKGYNPDRPA
jgi:hypothetical protein